MVLWLEISIAYLWEKIQKYSLLMLHRDVHNSFLASLFLNWSTDLKLPSVSSYRILLASFDVHFSICLALCLLLRLLKLFDHSIFKRLKVHKVIRHWEYYLGDIIHIRIAAAYFIVKTHLLLIILQGQNYINLMLISLCFLLQRRGY